MAPSEPTEYVLEDPPDEDHLHEFDPDSIVPQLLSFFGKKHTLAILYEFVFTEEPLRYSDVEEALDVSSTTLSERLSELVDGGYLTRESYDVIPPRVEYKATDKSRALAPVLVDVYEWAKEHEATPSDFH